MVLSFFQILQLRFVLAIACTISFIGVSFFFSCFSCWCYRPYESWQANNGDSVSLICDVAICNFIIRLIDTDIKNV
jgi:hypothetical protein